MNATRAANKKSVGYQRPSDEQSLALGAAIRELVTGPGSATELAARAGFELGGVSELPSARLLREIAAKRRGGGAYLVAANSSSLLVEAPHTFYDEGTLPLGFWLFQELGARAFFFNTVHRYAVESAAGHAPSDVAHAPDSLFHVATSAFVAALPTATVVQVHGFGQTDVPALAVISNGVNETVPDYIEAVRAALARAVAGAVFAYPRDTGKLGATSNVQGQMARARGARFVHLELSAELRQRLLADAALRDRVASALRGSLSERGSSAPR